MGLSITEYYTSLLTQSIGTAETYLLSGRRAIDDAFGEGYAAKHPELIAAFMRTATSYLAIGCQVEAIEAATEQFGTSMADLSDKLQIATDQFGTSMTDLSDTLDLIRDTIKLAKV